MDIVLKYDGSSELTENISFRIIHTPPIYPPEDQGIET